MRDTFLNDLMEQVKKADLRKKRRAILIQLAEKWENHDFCAEIPDDRWDDHVAPEFMGYLTEEEIAALEATEDAEEEGSNAAAVSGERVIAHAFVVWLAKAYGVTAEDLAED